MARIKRLKSKELSQLRNQILQTYALRNPRRILPPLNAYLPNYEELRSDIQEAVPHVNGSVSENRLRKLFYYTNPELLGPDSRKQGNFGVDFLDACYLYVSGNAQTRDQYLRELNQPTNGRKIRPHKTRLYSLIIAIPILLFSIIILSTANNRSEPMPFREDFVSANINDLTTNGWEIMDRNESYLQADQKPDRFTLHTLPGSYWVKPEEPMRIDNVLLRKLPKGAQGVRACFEHFHPSEDWQGTGLVLLPSDKSLDDIILVSYGYASQLLDEYDTPFVNCAYRLKGGVPKTPFHTTLAYPGMSDGEALRFDISWDSDKLVISHGMNEKGGFTQEWEPFKEMGELDITFDPGYVGFFACQGWTNDDRHTLNAEILPVYLDWVEIY